MFLALSTFVRYFAIFLTFLLCTACSNKSDSNQSDQLVAKYGFIDKTGKVIVKPQFDYVSINFLNAEPDSANEGLVPVQVGEKWGYIDTTGKTVIAPSYDEASAFSQGLASVKSNNHFGYIDKTGKYIIKPIFDCYVSPSTYKAPDFYENYYFYDSHNFAENGLAAVIVKGKWGYIDKTGKLVIPAKFDVGYPFKEGLAAINLDNKWGYINAKGKTIIPCQFARAKSFKQDGFAEVLIARPSGDNQKFRIIDKSGKFLTPEYALYECPPFPEQAKFDPNGIQPFENSDKFGPGYGYRKNGSGEIIIPSNPRFRHAYEFKNDLALIEYVTESGQGLSNEKRVWAFIDKKGNIVLQLPYGEGVHSVGYFSDGLLAVKDTEKTNKFGYIDKTGKWVIPPQFDEASNFIQGIAAIRVSEPKPASD